MLENDKQLPIRREVRKQGPLRRFHRKSAISSFTFVPSITGGAAANRIAISGLLLVAGVALAGDPQLVEPEPKPLTAFVNVNVVAMETEAVLPNQTVVVREGR